MFAQAATPLLPTWTALPVGAFVTLVAIMLVRQWLRADNGYDKLLAALTSQVEAQAAELAAVRAALDEERSARKDLEREVRHAQQVIGDQTAEIARLKALQGLHD
jgi:hypothetical protein